MYIINSSVEMDLVRLQGYIAEHRVANVRYQKLKNIYEGAHDILKRKAKGENKPDNRIVVNFAKYIVDISEGFFISIPIKMFHPDSLVSEYLVYLNKYNDLDDRVAELSKLCAIYGNGFEMVYIDEMGQTGVTYINPMEAFVVYDDSIVCRPKYGVRYFKNTDGVVEGSYSDAKFIYYFTELDDGTLVYSKEPQPHIFGAPPLTEYVANEERLGAFEGVISEINAYNNAISEKANDVDYFADAYIVTKGMDFGDKSSLFRDGRHIELLGRDVKDLDVFFLEKPNADTTQENLINRLSNLIFAMSMVMNINDPNFGTQSGIAIKYKLTAMENLAKIKERKFIAGFNRRFKMVANTGLTPLKGDEWMNIEFTFTRNYPANLLEESEIAKNLDGVVSKETALSVLSVVKNPKEEVQRIEAEGGTVV